MRKPHGLTGKERDRFVEWLREEVKASQEMILEIKQLNVPTTHLASHGSRIAVCLELINQLESS